MIAALIAAYCVLAFCVTVVAFVVISASDPQEPDLLDGMANVLIAFVCGVLWPVAAVLYGAAFLGRRVGGYIWYARNVRPDLDEPLT